MRNVGAQSNNRTGVKGVYWYPSRSKWRSTIFCAGKQISVGYFDSIDAAKAAYQDAKARIHGEFAVRV
jgi:hypothetical protein